MQYKKIGKLKFLKKKIGEKNLRIENREQKKLEFLNFLEIFIFALSIQAMDSEKFRRAEKPAGGKNVNLRGKKKWFLIIVTTNSNFKTKTW